MSADDPDLSEEDFRLLWSVIGKRHAGDKAHEEEGGDCWACRVMDWIAAHHIDLVERTVGNDVVVLP